MQLPLFDADCFGQALSAQPTKIDVLHTGPAKYHVSTSSDGLRKRGVRCKKSKEGPLFNVPKKGSRSSFSTVYKSKVVTKKKGLSFPKFFSKIMVFFKTKSSAVCDVLSLPIVVVYSV